MFEDILSFSADDREIYEKTIQRVPEKKQDGS